MSEKHELHLFCITHNKPSKSELAQVAPFCKSINYFPLPNSRRIKSVLKGWINGLPIHVAYFYDKKIHIQINSGLNKLAPDLVYCQLIRMMPYCAAINGIKWIDLMDAFSLNLRRRAMKANILNKIWLNIEAKKLADLESNAISQFEKVSIIAEADKNAILTRHSEKIVILPNGVDSDFFHLNSDIQPENDLVFAGNLGYEPNVAASKYLYELWLKNLKDLKVRIAGARPEKVLLRLNTTGFEVQGWVPDIRDLYWKGKIFVAPLFTGSGQQNKILEAMACGIPVITTTLVNEAIQANPGIEILLANTTEEFNYQIKILIDEPQKRNELIKAARQFIVKNYSWNKMGTIIEKIIQ